VTVSKSEFAALTGVTPARVSQWIREGKIGPDALVGAGRSARIRPDLARRQVGQRRDAAQAMANGLGTKLAGGASDQETDAALKAERLRELQFRNARAAEEALARRGVFVRADMVSPAMARMAAKMLTVFEAGLYEIADELAAQMGLDRRTVLHNVRGKWREIRAKAAEAARREAAEVPEFVEDEWLDEAGVVVGPPS
jgi:DNA-binding transcriptional regulator YdaS (Cro superfamily)